MYKKLLCTGVAVLSISSASFASGTMYTAPAPVATPAGCDTSDSYFYLGLQGGMANSGWKARDGEVLNSEIIPALPLMLKTTTLNTRSTNGIAGRAFLGYSFNKYFAAELGYLYLGKKTNIDVNVTSADFAGKVFDSQDVAINQIRTDAVDLVGKVKAPITDGLGVYAKLGAGYLMMKGTMDHTVMNLQNVHYGYESKKLDLVYGAGVSYDFNENWAMDVSWTRYNSGNTKINSGTWQPNVDFYALGVTYKLAGV